MHLAQYPVCTPAIEPGTLRSISIHFTFRLSIVHSNRSRVMDFAPYQDTTPESTRAHSPPPNRTSSPTRNARSPPPNRPHTDPFGASSLPAPSHFSDEPRGNTGFGGGDLESGRLDVNLFETSLPLRLDYEAMLAYLLLPPAGGVFLLVVEHKSDYVRYVKIGEAGVLVTRLL